MPLTKIQGLPDVKKLGDSNWRYGVYIKRPGDPDFVPVPHNAVKSIQIEYDIETTAITGKLTLDNEGNKVAEMFPLLGSEQWHIKIHPYEVDMLKQGFADDISKMTIEHTFDTLNLLLPNLEGVGVGYSSIDIDLIDTETNLLRQSGSFHKFIPANTRVSDWLKEQISRYLGAGFINEERWFGSDLKLEYPKQLSWNLFDIMHQLKYTMYNGDDNMYFLFRDRFGQFCLDTLNNIMKKPYHQNLLRFKDNSLSLSPGAGMLDQNTIHTASINTFDLPDIEDGFHGYNIKSFRPMAKRFFTESLTVQKHVEESKSAIGPGPSIIHRDFSKANNIKTRLVPWKDKPADRTVPYRRTMFTHSTHNAFSIDLWTYHGALDRFVGNQVSVTVPAGLKQTRYNRVYSGAYMSTKVTHVWTEHGYKNSMVVVKNTTTSSLARGYYGER